MKHQRPIFPSIRALQAFAAVARLENFSKAGDELGMTQSAVSHQIRMLEDLLGQPLFNRLHRNTVLTDAGRDLEVTLKDCFERLERGLKRLDQYRKPNQLIVYTRPDFANSYLVPRLPRLREAHPDLDIWLFSTDRGVDIVKGEIHLAIVPDGPEIADLEARPLLNDWLTPVCSPGLLAARGPVADAADLAEWPLLHDERREDWTRWFALVGHAHGGEARGYNFVDSSALLQAARQGLGVALGSLVLASAEIAGGALVTPCPRVIPADSPWMIALTEEAALKPKIQKFLAWLEAEAELTRQQLHPYLKSEE